MNESNFIKFGPSGNSASFYSEGFKHSVDAPRWLNGLGLKAYEYSFGKGILMSTKTAAELGANALKYGIEISAHAPYYINFANTDDSMIMKSIDYCLRSLRMVELFNGSRVVVHPAAQGKMERKDAVYTAGRNLVKLAEVIHENNLNGKIALETMGKIRQIGTVKEITEFCRIDDVFIPCVDFGHLNARTQGEISADPGEYRRILDDIGGALGEDKMKNIHIHFSKIKYGAGGEVCHLTFDDYQYGPDFEPLMRVLYEYGATPVVICESDGTMAEDALKMQNFYNALKTE